MSDLDPAPIERLLQEAAQRRGVPVDAYRDLVQAVADVAGVDFATALSTRSVFAVIHTVILLVLDHGVDPVRCFSGPLQQMPLDLSFKVIALPSIQAISLNLSGRQIG